EDDASGRVDPSEHARQECGLARAGASADQERQAGADEGGEEVRGLLGERARGDELVEVERAAAGDPQGDARAFRRHRWQDGVEWGAGGEAGVDVRRGDVEPAARGCREALGEAADGGLVRERDVGAGEALAGVDPHLVRAVDEDVGYAGEAEQWLEW